MMTGLEPRGVRRLRRLMTVSMLILMIRSRRLFRETVPESGMGSPCYEIFARSFFDSDGGGIGDFPASPAVSTTATTAMPRRPMTWESAASG